MAISIRPYFIPSKVDSPRALSRAANPVDSRLHLNPFITMLRMLLPKIFFVLFFVASLIHSAWADDYHLNSCGLLCARMIAEWTGREKVPIEKVFSGDFTSSPVLSMGNIQDLLRLLDLPTTALRLDFDDLISQGKMGVVHTGGNHFEALRAICPERSLVLIWNPSAGFSWESREAFVKRWQGVFLRLDGFMAIKSIVKEHPLAFFELEEGFPKDRIGKNYSEKKLWLENKGVAPLLLNSLIFSRPGFSLNSTETIALRKGERRLLMLNELPINCSAPAILTLHTNDPVAPSQSIRIQRIE